MRVRQRIWKAIRIEQTFTAEIIAFYAETSASYAALVLKQLHNHGYLSLKVKAGKKYYSLKKESRFFPAKCERCGNRVSAKECETFEHELTEQEYIELEDMIDTSMSKMTIKECIGGVKC